MTGLRQIALSLLACGLSLAPAHAREPLDFTGTPLDWRVLTRPGALMVDAAGSEIATGKPPVFSAFYVFAEQQTDGQHWLEIGANRDGGQTSWMRRDQTVDWKQTITLTFTNPADRVPVLFFGERAQLEGFVQDEAMSVRSELIARALRDGENVADTGVIAAEPAEQVSLTDQFYLLPILDHDRIRVNNRPRQILEVASINLNDVPPPATAAGPFKVGITFVVDNSTSMQPYIDRTRQAIRRILDGIPDSEDSDFSFGLVGFRSSTEMVPGLEYTSREFHALKPEFDRQAFLAALDQMNATDVSSHAFDEDGLSGFVAASKQDWSSFDGRYIIYISDAGMLVGEDLGSTAGTTPDLLATRLREDLGIATFALFLKTRPGRAYHADAIAQLEQLTRLGTSGRALVFPIEDGDVAAFGSAVDSLTDALIQNVGVQAAGRSAPDACDAGADPIRCAAIEAGYAMSLAWLGREVGAQAPTSYAAWAADFALDDPSRRAMTPRVLLTRAQLNDVYVTLQAVVEAYDQSVTDDPQKFFSVLKTVLARVLRDPGTLPALDSAQAPTVAAMDDFDDLGDLVGDYLQNLPYDSDFSNQTLENWIAREDSGRHEFIQGIKGKLTMYQLYYGDSANWVSLNPGASEGEKVYPIPLEMMP